MPANLTTRPLTGNIQLINNPELIKVKTIKKKYVEQMNFFLFSDTYATVDVIGQTKSYVIVKSQDRLGKISIADYRLFLIGLHQIQKPNCSNQESMDYALEVTEKIPLLFED